MKIIRNSGLIVLLATLLSCAGTSGTTSKTVGGNKDTNSKEDLSVFRPKFPPPPADAGTENAPAEPIVAVVPGNHVNRRVLALLDTVANANKGIKYAQGYRILAYTGTERKMAMDIRKAIIDRVPEERDYLQYRQPTFRLKVGDYLTRVEAQQVLSQIKDISPNALIISEQININR